MRAVASAFLVALVIQDPVCDHGTRGATRAVSLASVARIHAQAVRAFDLYSFERAGPPALPGFDSGLPACRMRAIRRLRVETLPPEMKSLFFAPTGTPVPTDALLVVTRARSIADVTVPADRELASRLGVRCAPSHVRLLSANEVEITEGGTP